MTDSLEERFRSILRSSIVAQVLPDIGAAALPDWWLAGGSVRNTVWKYLYGDQCNLVVNDFDVAFFDVDGGREQELVAKKALEDKHGGWKFDVKNQASFAVWRPGRRTYDSAEDGVGNWLHTATSVGVRLEPNGELSIFAPYGLEDLFGGIVRPTPEHVDGEVALAKAQSFLTACPPLKAVER